MLSNEYIRNFLELNRHVKSIKHRHRRGQTSCYLCLPGFEDFRQGYGWNCLGVRPPMKVTCQLCTPDLGEEHGEWNCLKYDTPMKVRRRLMARHAPAVVVLPRHILTLYSIHLKSMGFIIVKDWSFFFPMLSEVHEIHGSSFFAEDTPEAWYCYFEANNSAMLQFSSKEVLGRSIRRRRRRKLINCENVLSTK